MEEREHQFFMTARNKEVAQKLLLAYGIEFKSRGKGGKGLFEKIIYTLRTDFQLLNFARTFKPDILLSCSSPYLAHVSNRINKPHICIDDTDIAKYEHLMYVPFSDCIISPVGYNKNFGKKHIFVNSIFDLLYLHPRYYTSDPTIKEKLRIDDRKKTVFMRFTSMSANHDWGYNKISFADKLLMINKLSEKYRVIISSEVELPDNLKQYKINFEPEEIHSALSYCDLFIGESGSMSTEAAILGIPSINLTASANDVGVFKQLVEKKLLFLIPHAEQALQKAVQILTNENFDINVYRLSINEFISKKLDLTSFLVWFVENYPDSKTAVQENPEIQNNFY
jgi:predicted glycosyltransferase